MELIDGSLLDQYGALEKVAREIRAQLRTVLGLDCKVTLVEPRSIERSTGKAKRIVDLRNEPVFIRRKSHAGQTNFCICTK